MRLLDRRGLYAIVDPACCAHREPVQVAEAILRGGCAALQLRVKEPTTDRALLEVAKRLRRACAVAEVPFVMNDRADLAVLVEADGLHLGQDDLTVQQARRIVGDLPIGVSTHDARQASEAMDSGADLIGFGPVYATRTKHNPDPVVGLDGLEDVCRSARVPVVAIGGLDAARASDAARAGATFVAAISAVCAAPDPERAAAEMHRAALGEPE